MKKRKSAADLCLALAGITPTFNRNQGWKMRILVACECSGEIRDALLALGHDAISCDTKPTRKPGPHYCGDVRDILYDQWDGLVAHPVCKYLTNAGSKHLYRRIDGVWSKDNGPDPERWQNMREGAEFYKLFDRADHIPRRIIENPIMHGHAMKEIGLTRKNIQYVQPWQFGDPFSKATGLRIIGLPRLVPKFKKSDYAPGTIKQEVWLMGPSDDREEKRSKTYPGIAKAVAELFGKQTAQAAA
ncbi:hypothetical protein UFOVP1349_29 [uncultured Caudovirales phage]|uniref:Uncharacterized protein n=1 Tax=uncultured Caudovirales phage TaxID=2100421 RepID=A0A6J5SI86_9CAUD|nr:hypothetical protein UFOVP925_14 [uncultured Caudovirales phage]CAB4184203.1 hypothetical protein UFOVP1097_35 [uncultured Caudovirales phage]CAB4200124.1 hypothetical protein UFOVP1349_29 [uncultured Caudovirales phage]CAB4214005.1 hypothetical protein UFOVP1456_9 [uncultured Caudovirales phage]